jgi:hypothetical protein
MSLKRGGVMPDITTTGTPGDSTRPALSRAMRILVQEAVAGRRLRATELTRVIARKSRAARPEYAHASEPEAMQDEAGEY